MTITWKNAGIAEALDYKLSTLTLSPVRRVSWRNLPFTPVTNEIYLKPFYMPAGSNYAAIGADLRRHIGLYQVNVVGPVGVTPVTQDAIADLIVEHFVNQTISRNGLLVRIGVITGSSGNSVPSPAPEIIVDGWRTIPITVPWWLDTLEA